MLQQESERFEIFGIDGKWIIKDNKELPHLLDFYQTCVKLNQQAERIAELEERFNNLLEIRYKTPHIERFAVVQYIHWEKKPYKVVKCFDAYKDKDFNIVPCFYDCGSTNFKVIQICDTKEDALKKLEELQKLK